MRLWPHINEEPYVIQRKQKQTFGHFYRLDVQCRVNRLFYIPSLARAFAIWRPFGTDPGSITSTHLKHSFPDRRTKEDEADRRTKEDEARASLFTRV